MTPRRLLDTTRNDFERALLGSATSERAPEALRARILASVSAPASEVAAAPCAGAERGHPGTGAARVSPPSEEAAPELPGAH